MTAEEIKLNKFFKLLGDNSKFKIILELLDGEKCVCVIYKKLNLNQTLVSHHLSALKRAGLIKSKKSGRWVYYSINEEEFKILKNLFSKVLELNKDLGELLEYNPCNKSFEKIG